MRVLMYGVLTFILRNDIFSVRQVLTTKLNLSGREKHEQRKGIHIQTRA
jgi:hypothetical protein